MPTYDFDIEPFTLIFCLSKAELVIDRTEETKKIINDYHDMLDETLYQNFDCLLYNYEAKKNQYGKTVAKVVLEQLGGYICEMYMEKQRLVSLLNHYTFKKLLKDKYIAEYFETIKLTKEDLVRK